MFLQLAYGLSGGFGRSLSPLSIGLITSPEVSRALSSVEHDIIEPKVARSVRVRMNFFMVVRNGSKIFIRCFIFRLWPKWRFWKILITIVNWFDYFP